jgi:hypothetical protein
MKSYVFNVRDQFETGLMSSYVQNGMNYAFKAH